MATALDTLEQKVAALLRALEEQGLKQEYGNVLREILRELQQYHAKIGSLRTNLDQVGEVLHHEVESNYSEIESLKTDLEKVEKEVYGSLESKIKSLGLELDIFKEEIDFLKRTPVASLSDFKEGVLGVLVTSPNRSFDHREGVQIVVSNGKEIVYMTTAYRYGSTYHTQEAAHGFCERKLPGGNYQLTIYYPHKRIMNITVDGDTYMDIDLEKRQEIEPIQFTGAATPILPSLPSPELPSASIITTHSVVRTSYFHQTANRVSSFFKRHGLLLLAGTVLATTGGYGVYRVVQRQRMNSYFEDGQAELRANNNEAAINDFNQVIALNADNVEAYNNRGIAHYNQKEYAAALSDYNQAIALNQNFFYAYHNRALVWQAKGETEKAAKDFGMEAVIKQRVGLTTP